VVAQAGPSFLSFSSSAKVPQGNPNQVVVQSNENVPEGHAGLHGELYGDETAHKEDRETRLLEGEAEGSFLFPLQEWLSKREGTKPCGLYAIYDTERKLQFVGYSRNMVLAVRGYAEAIDDSSCAFCRIKVVTGNRMKSRANLKRERDLWLEDLTSSKDGSLGPDNKLFESLANKAKVARTEAEEAAFQEQKFKMKKAMGNSLDQAEENEDESQEQRRLNTIKAIEGDDWSEVIDRQTKETIVDAPPKTSQQQQQIDQDQNMVSPFASSSSSSTAAKTSQDRVMDVNSVNEVLDEVRPYLIADGGNVQVVDVEGGVVKLRLEGACGSCGSATQTMSMGIERALRNNFGDKVKEVVRVDQANAEEAAAAAKISAKNVDDHLNMLRPAIEGYGGKVVVKSLDDRTSVCTVQYKGPPPLANGIKAAIKDRFPTIPEVVIENID
jgi:Fe-S cluster biogenesis protein NfuA